MKKQNKIRQHIRFTGRVQGVGFRYTAQNAANYYGLTGWVYNEYDGSVVMEIQGPENTIEKAIKKLEAGTFIEIDNMEVTQLPVLINEGSFYIKDW